VSSRELVQACLVRIAERDGIHSFDGDPASVNAWIRVYEEDALTAAARADDTRARGDAGPLAGIPVGLKDLYAVEGKPLTASSRLLDDRPARSSEVWERLERAGMVLLGHLHTHEFAIGGTTDQVGNPLRLDRSAGGSSGGSAAALAARMVPAATGTDTAGSLRIPSALCGTATIKPTRGLVPLAGVVPLGPTLDHAGPMARSPADCAALLAPLAGSEPVPAKPLAELRLALSPRTALVEIDAPVARGLDDVLARVDRAAPPSPDLQLDLGDAYLELLLTELRPYHRRFDDRRELYRPALREWVEAAEERALRPGQVAALQERRAAAAAAWTAWFAVHRIDALLEPTVPCVAPLRGSGYDHAFTDARLIALTHYWNWVGLPVAAFPSGIDAATGLPVSASLIGPPGSEWQLLAAAEELYAR
jgi:aspartyl-tRNA(Asn)/glutamyl-tRNA(Gln) amidotransferase subunit A